MGAGRVCRYTRVGWKLNIGIHSAQQESSFDFQFSDAKSISTAVADLYTLFAVDDVRQAKDGDPPAVQVRLFQL
jgi:hypothetical protein